MNIKRQARLSVWLGLRSSELNQNQPQPRHVQWHQWQSPFAPQRLTDSRSWHSLLHIHVPGASTRMPPPTYSVHLTYSSRLMKACKSLFPHLRGSLPLVVVVVVVCLVVAGVSDSDPRL